ncbi:MAG: hypothetical protein M1118_00725 [Chloroflexi bacterium]|nr:hypothetical protein [Chloroflexota bacterium]
MEPTKVIQLSEADCWAIDYLIRHTWKDDDGPPGGAKGLLIKVFSLLKEFEAGSKAPTLPIALTEHECWCIDFNIRHDLNMGHEAVGKRLLLQVFGLILEFQNELATEKSLRGFGWTPRSTRPSDQSPADSAEG